jgi:hypothetical protein
MDSLAQELIDEIIGHIPRWDTCASSLVGRRWRHRSQQRYFESVCFLGENLILWEKKIPQDPDGIPSYVHHVRFQAVPFHFQPAIVSRVLKTFRSTISLALAHTDFPRPDELAALVSLGEFGRTVTRLSLTRSLYAPFTAVMSLIFSFPNLKELVINEINLTSYELPPTLPNTSRMGPLELLDLRKTPKEVSIALAKCRLASRTLFLNLWDEGMELPLTTCSEGLVVLTLLGA